MATVVPDPKCPSDLGAFLKPVFDEVVQLFDKSFFSEMEQLCVQLLT